MFKARPKQSGFCLCGLHQRHINTGPEKPHQHAQAGSAPQRRASNATLADRKNGYGTAPLIGL